MPAAAATAASAAATIGSAALSSSAAGGAAKDAKDAQTANLNFAKGVYSDAGANLSPSIQRGNNAGSALEGLLGIGGDPAASKAAWDNYRNSTNYNFMFDQGTQAVKTANAPAFNSGATAKALTQYGQGFAGNALQGYEGILQGQNQLGVQSALGLGSIGVGQSGQVSAANNNAAGAAGSAGIYQANATGSALQGLSSLINKAQTASSYGTALNGLDGATIPSNPTFNFGA